VIVGDAIWDMHAAQRAGIFAVRYSAVAPRAEHPWLSLHNRLRYVCH